MVTAKQGPSAQLFGFVALGAFIAVAINPYALLLFAPIFFGAPHAFSDIWFLLVNESGVQPRARVAIATLSALLLLNALMSFANLGFSKQIDSILIVALLTVPMVLSRRGKLNIYVIFFVLIVGYLLLATDFPLRAVVAHLHNFVALMFLFAVAYPQWRKSGVLLASWVVGVICVAGMLISYCSQSVLTQTIHQPIWSPFLSLTFSASAALSAALLFSYSFLQLMHFVVWIGFLPGLKRQTSLSAPLRNLDKRLIAGLSIVAILVALAAPLAAVYDPVQSRQVYLTLVSFHGWMELSWLLAHFSVLVTSGNLSWRKVFAIEDWQYV